MKLHFVTRAAYKNKETVKYIEYLNSQFGSFYLIPEGGTNALAVKGCEEILTEKDVDFDFITTSVGTGGTIAGIVNCSKLRQQVLGFPALKGEFLQNDIAKFTKKDNWRLINEYHFGGYAKTTPSLIAFINGFKQETGIALDPIYTGKMLYGILEMVKDGYFVESSSILAIHTGGLQGIEGMNTRLGLKGELTII
jgi:1-aminocyclopropane-1-carboxylate deaminase